MGLAVVGEECLRLGSVEFWEVEEAFLPLDGSNMSAIGWGRGRGDSIGLRRRLLSDMMAISEMDVLAGVGLVVRSHLDRPLI